MAVLKDHADAKYQLKSSSATTRFYADRVADGHCDHRDHADNVAGGHVWHY